MLMDNIAASVVVVAPMGAMPFLTNYAWQVNIAREVNGEINERN